MLALGQIDTHVDYGMEQFSPDPPPVFVAPSPARAPTYTDAPTCTLMTSHIVGQ
ncbi:hypothetical protein AcW2_005716 [Taiwanofungus camphoratus]|nr:hypothetical protein AcW2_005716 [Antrodia cinnamomea]